MLGDEVISAERASVLVDVLRKARMPTEAQRLAPLVVAEKLSSSDAANKSSELRSVFNDIFIQSWPRFCMDLAETLGINDVKRMHDFKARNIASILMQNRMISQSSQTRISTELRAASTLRPAPTSSELLAPASLSARPQYSPSSSQAHLKASSSSKPSRAALLSLSVLGCMPRWLLFSRQRRLAQVAADAAGSAPVRRLYEAQSFRQCCWNLNYLIRVNVAHLNAESTERLLRCMNLMVYLEDPQHGSLLTETNYRRFGLHQVESFPTRKCAFLFVCHCARQGCESIRYFPVLYLQHLRHSGGAHEQTD